MKIVVAIEGDNKLADMFEDMVYALAQSWTFQNVVVSEEWREE